MDNHQLGESSSSKNPSTKRPATRPHVSAQLPSTRNKKPRQKAHDPPWPEHLNDLQRVFQALNTVFTFCSARKHLHTTIDNMRSSVESLLNARLKLESIAQIKTLLPVVVRFLYVERETLGALEKLTSKRKTVKNDFAIYDHTQDPSLVDGKAKVEDQVLLFQFIDGELKTPQKSNISASPTGSRKPSRKLKSTQPTIKELLMPTYSPKVMTKMIEKRNLKFKEAVDEFLLACAAQDPPVDPVTLLINSSIDYMPYPHDLPPDEKAIQTGKQRLQHYLDHPEEKPSIQSLLSGLKSAVHYRDQIVPGGQRTTPSRDAVYGKLDQPLSTTLATALSLTKQIKQLYSHQADAINHLSTGAHVIVSTSTSSGKSIIYQLPMLQALENSQSSCGLYIFPTKALAQDQKRALNDLIHQCGESPLADTKIATFDGDTPKEDRPSIRETANIIYTNPDMLHLTILPNEELWRRFFQNLKFVVLDELHVYTGLFGSHMSYIMRRLRRICEAVGNPLVQFISCSATIQNPVQHMKTLFGISDVRLVSRDGSPSGSKQHVIWNPPVLDEKDPSQGRLSSISETSRIFRFLISNGTRTIVFCRNRKTCELMIKQVKEQLVGEDRRDLASRIKSYRSGYTAQERRLIEQEMYNGELLGIVATSALELGIDIGNLDAVLTVGFPHSLSGLRQQAGRAGRRNKESLSMLILDQKSSNQFFAQNPDELFDANEPGIFLDLENDSVFAGHLQCAADEIPIHEVDDQVYFEGIDLADFCRENLVKDEYGYFHPHPRFKPSPAQHLPIRKNEEVSYSIVDMSTELEPKILEEMEASRVMYECYEGAIFIHQGRTLQVFGLDHSAAICKMREVSVDYLTRPRELNELDPVRTMRITSIANSPNFVCYGTIKLISTVYGYVKLDKRQNILDSFELTTEPLIKYSKGFWVDLPSATIISLRKLQIHLSTAVHAAEHVLLNLAGDDLRVDCRGYEDPWSVSGTDKLRRNQPARLILFDHPTKSGGVSIKAFEKLTNLMNQAVDLLDQCECEEGCKSCLMARFTCSKGALMVQGAKFGAKVVLNSLLGREWIADEENEDEILNKN